MAASTKKERGDLKLPQNCSLEPDQQKQFNKKVKEIKKKGSGGDHGGGSKGKGVVYVGNIPHGFFEPQMKKFFSQFGNVRRLKLCRSKKTGRSKGYAFIEFQVDKVAQVVADTMNNYLMFERLIKCQYIPAAKLHPETFRGCHRKFSFPKAHILSIDRHNNLKKEKKATETIKRFVKSYKTKMDKLKALGIDFHLNSVEKAVEEGVAKLKETPKQKPDKKEKAKKMKESTPAMKTSKLQKKIKMDGDTSIEGVATQILVEDSEEDEISFKTPPNTIKSSRLLSKSATVTKDKKNVKRLADNTPNIGNSLKSSKTGSKRKLLRKSV